MEVPPADNATADTATFIFRVLLAATAPKQLVEERCQSKQKQVSATRSSTSRTCNLPQIHQCRHRQSRPNPQVGKGYVPVSRRDRKTGDMPEHFHHPNSPLTPDMNRSHRHLCQPFGKSAGFRHNVGDSSITHAA